MQNLTPNTEATLIPVFTAEIGGFAVLAVDARELHQFLGAKRDFPNWIKKRLTENKFVEGEDFTLANSGELTNPGLQTRIDYILELNTAKELAMQEKNEIGRMVRKYFIDCERKIHETSQTTTQNTSQPRDEGQYIFGFFQHPPQNDTELIKFVNEWVPSFFREKANVA